MPPLRREDAYASQSGPQALTANEMGRQIMPMVQPFIAPRPEPVVRTMGLPGQPSVQTNVEYGTSTKEGRPYADIGKMSLSLAAPREIGEGGVAAKGALEGIGAGIGRTIGGIFGPGAEQGGANIGEAIGTVLGAPLNVLGGIAGAIPAIPFLPGSGFTIPGSSLMSLPEAQRNEMLGRWDGNPATLARFMGDLDKEAFQAKVDSGEINPIMAALGRPAGSLGDQLWNALGIVGIPSQLVTRTVAGLVGRAEDVVATNDADLAPEIAAIKGQYQRGEITRDRFLDLLVVNNAGYSNHWLLNLLGEAVLDPANLAMGAGITLGFMTKSAKAGRAIGFVEQIGKEGAETLAKSFSDNVLKATGDVVPWEHVTPPQLVAEAERLGTHGAALTAATDALPARLQAALTPGWAQMEKVADVTSKILDPTNLIGRRGTKPLLNAHIAREGTYGVALGYGLKEYGQVGDRLEQVGLGHLFTKGMGYFTAQVNWWMHGDELMEDVQHVRNIANVAPTKVVEARAQVGAKGHAQRVERWVGRRMTDVGLLVGGSPAERAARMEAKSINKLIRLGATEAQAQHVVRGLSEKGHSLIHANYFGNRIESYNIAKNLAREQVTAKIRSGAISEEAGNALLETVDRLTLIGPEELTKARADNLRKIIADGLKANDATATREAIRRYDLLAYQFAADLGEDEALMRAVLKYLDDHGASLTEELSEAAIKRLDAVGADLAKNGGDDYLYGLRPKDGTSEWRAAIDLETGVITSAKPFIDIVPLGQMAEGWNQKFRNLGGPFGSFANGVERSVRGIGAQITSDRIDREARRAFVDRAMIRVPVAGMKGGTTGLTVNESRALYDAVKQRALDASTTPRGMYLDEFEQIIRASPAAMRVGMSGRDLMGITLVSFEGHVGTVGLTQKLTGQLKTTFQNVPFMPANTLGVIAERMYPMIRFTYNPLFQLQEWAEPWFFSAARGKLAIGRGVEVYDPISGGTKTLSADEVDRLQQHMIDRYSAASPEAQFDMMERSLVYFHGAKAAKEFSRATNMNQIRGIFSGLARQGAGTRKRAAQNEMFRYFLGDLLKERFDAINPNYWYTLEKWAGTTDRGVIALRWGVEKDLWGIADPRYSYHVMDAMKQPAYGARSLVNLEENARQIFKTTREALNERVKKWIDDPADADGLSYDDFFDQMREVGAHEEYIGTTWKYMLLDARSGGIDGWWDDVGRVAAGGKTEGLQLRKIWQQFAEAKGMSEGQFIAQTIQRSPVSLLADDLLAMSPADLKAWGVLLQATDDLAEAGIEIVEGVPVATRIGIDAETGLPVKMYGTPEDVEAEFLADAMNPPSGIGDPGNLNFERVPFVSAEGIGRSLYIPGGRAALLDMETAWTPWEAHVLRGQLLDPNDLKDPVLRHALDEKMWRAHTIAMEDPANIHALYNNYAFAMNSAQMNLTQNEMVASRLRVGSETDLRNLAAEGDKLAAAIRSRLPEGAEVTPNDLGLAYSTNPWVANYIPLDNRMAYVNDTMLEGTRTKIEQRATVVNLYLTRTSKERRARHRVLEDEVVLVPSYDKAGKRNLDDNGNPAFRKTKPYTPLVNWAVEELAEAVFKGRAEAIRGLSWGHVIAQYPAGASQAELDAIFDAAAKLVQNPDDLAARKALAPFVGDMKGVDEGVIFKDFNVNGAGYDPATAPTGSNIFSGVDDTYAYLKNDDVTWRSTGTNANIGRSVQMAMDMRDNPGLYRRRTDFVHPDGTVGLEPLDVMGERISHRTSGLSLKTGYFGADLGDPMRFEKGVHDIHMVGELTQWMYYTKRGEFDEWLTTLSPNKQKLIRKWISEGAEKGAGKFKWQEAEGVEISFKPGKADARRLENDIAGRAQWVRDRVQRAVEDEDKPNFTEAQQQRLASMYRTDEEWADLFGRPDVKVYGGDYQRFEDTMTRWKAEAEAVGDDYGNMLKRHGNGGFQWKLWDERRNLWDPELNAFAEVHTMTHKGVKYMVTSNDLHKLGYFMSKTGQPSVAAEGERYMDLLNAINFQREGKKIRGATFTTDQLDRIVAATQHKNRTTMLHEILHGTYDSILDPSGRRVVWEDMNRRIALANADIVPGGATYEATKTAAAQARIAADDASLVFTQRQTVHGEAKKAADAATSAVRALETQTRALNDAVGEAKGALAQLKRDAPARIKSIKAQGLAPSVEKRRLATVQNEIDRGVKALEDRIAKRDKVRDAIPPAKDKVRVARETEAAAKAELDAATGVFRGAEKADKAAREAMDKIMASSISPQKAGWDDEVEHYFIEEFQKWIVTGKVDNPKLRDAFAYFRQVLIRIYKWAKDDPSIKVSDELEKLFNEVTTPRHVEMEAFANPVHFDATEEMFHSAYMQSVNDAENAAFTNVQFRRGRSWAERSINHPYFGIYPASYMWGKVAPEMIRALAANPFGLPIPILTKPVKIGGYEVGLHGSPFYGYVNAVRAQNALEMQKDNDPEFKKAVEDPDNQQVWRNLMMFLPGTPWDLPANMPLWTRRIGEYGLEAQEAAATGKKQPSFELAGVASDVLSYAFGPKTTVDWLGDIGKMAADDTTAATALPTSMQALKVVPGGIVTTETALPQAAQQTREIFNR